MFCLASSPLSALNESTRVSNAESQLAVPLAMTTFLASNVIGSPKGSAVCTVADGAGVGACAADGAGDADGWGEALAAGAGLAAALGAGEGLAEAAGAGDGDCASVAPALSQSAATGISAAKMKREGRNF